ncbi:putative growth protein (boi2) [Anaeramoeba ignava]|uniref:Growth protein (Boi2) n=1 Tax=Anaeramoeba ignava TaxID=1746090 RepID=A0A9Q0LTJ3_ANAIG|nr:putative growth protein (boi2) [Anaeramoeba ignava]
MILNINQKAIARFNYASTDPKVLFFNENDEIIINEQINKKWVKGKLVKNNIEGIFPLNYVKLQNPIDPKLDPKLKYQKNFNQETMEIFLTDLNPETSYLESALIKKQTVPLIKLYKPTRLPLFPFSRKGWLMIGSSNGKWKKKYCVLENLSLRYFPSEKENENEMKSIYIDKIMCVIRDSFQKTEKNSDSKTKANSNQKSKSKSKSKSNNKNDENFTFRIITKNQKNYHFQANSKKEMDDWINIICLFHDLLKFCSYSSTTEDIPTLKSLIQLMEIVYRRILEIKSKNNDQENEEIQTTSKTIELWMNLLLFKYYLVLKDKFNGESYAISIRDQESEAQHDLELRKYDYLKILFAKQEEKWIGKGEKSDGYFTQESIALLAFDSNQENGQKSDDKFDDEPLFFEGKETRNFVSNDLPEGFLINKALSILNYETKTNEFVIQKNGILCYETTQGWKKKYLILNNFYLNIYASDKEKNPEQTILLDKTTKIEKLQPKDKKNIFAISTKEYAIFKFYSTNLFVIQEWIQMIQISIYLLNIYEPINSENREIESKIHEIEELLKWIQESILNSEILISSLRKMENVGFFQNVSRRLSSSRKNEKNTILQDFQNQPFLQRPRQKIRKERSLLSTTSKNQTEEERRKTIENLLDLVDDEIAKEQNEESNSPQKNILKPGIVRLNTDKKVTKRNIYELERYRRRIPKTPTKNINDVSYYRNIRISSLFLEISLFKKIKRKLVKILGRLKFPNLSNDAFIGFTLSNTKIEPSNSSSHLNQKNILKHDIVKKQVLKKEIAKPQEIKKDEWFQIEIENENENQESRFLNIKYQNEIWQIEKSKVMNFKIESDFNVFKIDNNNNLSNSQDNETIQLKIDILELEKLKLTQKEAISPHSPLSKRVAPVRFTYSFLSDLETNSRSRIYSFNLNNLPRKKSIQLSHYYFEKWKQINLNDEQQFPIYCSDSLLFLSNKKWITRWIMLNNWILSVNKSNYSPKPEKIYDLRDIISIKKEKSLFGQNNVLTIQMPDIIISLASEDILKNRSWVDQISALFNFIRFIASENNERKEEVDIIIYRLKSLLDWIQQQLKNYQKEKEEHETMIQLYKEIDSQTTFSFEKRIEICDYKTNHLIHWRKKILKRLLDTKLPERNRINFYGYIWKNFPQKLMKQKLDEKIITNYEKGDWIILNINNEKTKKFDLNELIHSDQEFIEGMIIRTKEKGSIFKKHVHLVEEIEVKKEEQKNEDDIFQIIPETKDRKEKEKEMAFDTESINEKEPPVHKTGAVYLSRSRLKLSSRWKIRSIEINGYNLNICHIDTNKQKILFAFSAEEEQKDWLQNFQILNYFLFLSNIVVEYNYTVSNNTDNKDGNHIHQNRNENLESIKKMYHNVEQRKELLYKSAFQNRHFTPFKQGQLRQFLNKRRKSWIYYSHP